MDQLTEVHVRSWQSAYAGLIPRRLLDNIDPVVRRSSWARRLHDHATGTAVATAPAGVIGLASFGPYRDGRGNMEVGELRAIYVLEEYWRQGVGSRLLEFAISRLRDHYDEVALWVLASNARAIDFYRRHGFREDGAEKAESFGGTVLQEVRMAKLIDS